jgi:hypothetical protein
MMSQGIEMRIDRDCLGYAHPPATELRDGTVANVYALDRDRQKNSRRYIAVPVGKGESFARVELESGRYLIELLLPSGDILSEEAAVETDRWSRIEFKEQGTAHEWHSWQNLLGNLESASTYRKSAIVPASPMEVRELHDQGGSPSGGRIWNLLSDLVRDAIAPTPPIVCSRIGSHSNPLTSTFSDEATRIYRLGSGSGRPTDRQYVLASLQSSLELASVPLPWSTLGGTLVPVELFIRIGEGNKMTMAFSVLDQYLGAALGYMARGALQSAIHLINQGDMMDILFDKRESPLAAAAAGYLLLGTQKVTEPAKWHTWIQNLMELFPWLPDGAIQYAWLRLKHGLSPQNVSDARQALTEAYNRGLPYYSLGLQWMVDSFTLLGEEVGGMSAAVQRVAWRTNMSQPFTTISLAR